QVEWWDLTEIGAPRKQLEFQSTIGMDKCSICQVKLSPNGRWITLQSATDKDSFLVASIDGRSQFGEGLRISVDGMRHKGGELAIERGFFGITRMHAIEACEIPLLRSPSAPVWPATSAVRAVSSHLDHSP